LNLLFSNLFTKELNSLSFLLISLASDLIVTDLQVELIDFSFGSSLPGSLVLQLSFEFIESCLQSSLLTVQTVDLLSKTFLVRASDIESLDGLLNVLHATALFFVELSALLFKSLSAGSPVRFKLLLMTLIDPQFS